ncbi:MAG: Crp/Fnr family transcriptional regulator [Halobacteriota archaeon]
MAQKATQLNLILSRLSGSDLRLLQPHLKPVVLPLRKVLERRGKPIKAIYFPDSGFASVVANGNSRPIEVGLIGREGMTGLAVLLGSDSNFNEVYMQAPGHGHCIRANELRKAIDKSVTLHRSLLLFAHAFLEQATRTAVANGRSKIGERLARWLLMADDRLDGSELPLTHEFLAMMLGVRRPGVTIAVQELEREGVIARKRGCIVITDRKALKKLSNGTYAPADYR